MFSILAGFTITYGVFYLPEGPCCTTTIQMAILNILLLMQLGHMTAL